MNMSHALRIQINKVLWITIFWMLIGSFQLWFELSVQKTAHCPPGDVNPFTLFLASIASTGVAGLVGGSLVVFFFGKWIRIWPYWRAALSILAAFTALFVFVSVIGFFIVAGQSEMPPEAGGSKFLWYILFTGSEYFIRSYIMWFFIVIATLFGLIVYDKYGPGALRKLLIGKYFKPKSEERVFMFLDLRSSTEIAERMGEKRYFNLLRDVIQDVTTPILAAQGEIYQYVGDEIVISWPTSNATRNVNCLNCFFSIREAMQKRAAYYREKYDLLPEYKAGLHYGNVIAGEIGVVKRDITYTGDVLNTASRIQSKCNEFGVDILLSKHLLDILQLIPGQFQPREIGVVPLRGKVQGELLYTV